MNFNKVIGGAAYRIVGSLRESLCVLAMGVLGWSVYTAVVPGAGVAYAQNSNATIRGQVLDQTGALIANAQVVIVNESTNVTVFNGKSDSAGAFVAPQVAPGSYKVTVTAEGQKQAVISNLIATVSQVASVNITMQVGQVSEVITVESKGEQLDRSTSNISTLISPQDVENLPLNNRAPENLLAFVPGVASGGSPTSVNTSQLSINGSRTLNTEVLLNGVSTIVASTGTPLTLPSPDGIDQLRFLTANAPAEYGRTSGAVLAANTRFGTNVYHGNVYALVQNEALNANSYFNKINPANVTPRNRRRFYQAGGSLGGPVRIPHLYNGRDKLFFFVNYDRTIQLNSGVSTITVPDADKRAGIFNPTSDASKLNKIYRPRTSTPYPTLPNGGQKITDPVDPATAKILAMLPLPNYPGTEDVANGRYTGNFRLQQKTTTDVLRLVSRVDYQATQNDRLSFNLYRYNNNSPNAIVYNVPLLNTNFDCSCSNSWIGSVDYTRIWTSTLVMDLNMGFFRNAVFRNPPGTGFGASSALGIGNLPLDQTPQITYNGYNNVGADTNTNQINITNTFAPFGTVTKTFGAHSFKFGASLRKNQFNSYNPSASPEGTINFSGVITNRALSGNPTTGVADFLLGKIASGNYQLPMPPTGRRNFNLGIFFQDDYKVTPKLTINAGLRYEYESPMIVSNDVYSRLDPATGTLLAAGLNGVSRSLNITTPKMNFSPRIGLAYSIDSKTVLRAAFGTFYSTIFQNLGGQIAFPGYDLTETFTLNPNTPAATNPTAGVPLAFGLSQAFSNANLVPQDLKNPFTAFNAATVTAPYTSSGVAFDKLSPMPMVQQWNVGVQRQLPLGVIFEANYVGNHTLHLPYNIPMNIVPLTQANAQKIVQSGSSLAVIQPLRQFPKLRSFTEIQHVGMSNYNSLQLTARRQFSSKFVLLSSYTYAKALDDGSTIYNFSAPGGTANAQYVGDPDLRKRDYAVSNIDLKHRVNVAFQYTSSGPWWLRGWRIAPAFVGQTGLPINITQSNNGVIDVTQQRPNGRAQDIVLKHPYFDGTALRYFQSPSTSSVPVADSTYPLTPAGIIQNTAKTGFLVPGTLGTMPRDAVRAFGQIQFDASVSKTFSLYRELKFQLRVDAFNVLNHTNFTAPNSSLSAAADCAKNTAGACIGPEVANFRGGSSGFGQITGTQPSRNMQIVGRFNF
jgi:hypothetical protein